MSGPSLLYVQQSLRSNESPVDPQAQEKDTLPKCMHINKLDTALAGVPASIPVSVSEKSYRRTDHAEYHEQKRNLPPLIQKDRNGPEGGSEFCEEDETTERPNTSMPDNAARDGVHPPLFVSNRHPSAHRTQRRSQRLSVLTGRTRRPFRKIQNRVSKETKPTPQDNTIMELMPLAASGNKFLDTDGDIIFPSIKEFCEMTEIDKREWQYARYLF
ncbi:hypothetical protein FPRO05_03204 [Fusarium proliferatum]|uniref:Uncharacterized protein n=1 Tax=Gibberella intermedia TaxID=948311 RepID=A0A365N137_GIBIN|nr:hypothetical protein FPRO05_03204 [Fusarium proliferatum]